MDLDQTARLIRRHEGTRYKLYYDTEMVLTGGVGHAFTVGSSLPVDVVERLFWHDMYNAYKDFERLGLNHISETRKVVLVNMLFNLGLPRLLEFKRMLNAIRANDCDDVAKEMFDSKWARQVGRRAEELAMMYYDDKEI